MDRDRIIDEIDILGDDTLESVVYTLLAIRARGGHAFGVFNGVTLYSDDVSMDSAYLAVTGYTKKDYEDSIGGVVYPIMEEEVDDLLGTDLEEVVLELLKLRDEGRHVKYDFNGVMLHSDTVTMDSAYVAVTGYPKDEFDRLVEEALKEEEEDTSSIEFQEKIESWISDGFNLIYPEKQDAWIEYVESHSKGLFAGADVEETLAIMKLLDANASIFEIRNYMDKANYSGYALVMIRKAVLNFSKRGPEFYKQTAFTSLTSEELYRVDEIAKENKKFEENENQSTK